MPHLQGVSELLDSEVNDSTNYVDPDSLISSVMDETRVAPPKPKATAVKKSRKRKCVTMPKRKPATVKREESVVEVVERIHPKFQTNGQKRKRQDVARSDVDEDDLIESTIHHAAEQSNDRGRPKGGKNKSPAAKPNKPAKTKTRMEEEEQTDEEVETSILAMRSNFAVTKTAKPTSKNTLETKTGPVKKASNKRTEHIPKPAETNDETDEGARIYEDAPPRKRIHLESTARIAPVHRRRAGSASDVERGDPMLRRKLGDVTRRFENIENKYQSLKETGIYEADKNVEKLRKQCEAITEASNKLVSSLKKELELQAPIVAEAKRAQRDSHDNDAELSKLRSSNNELSASLTSAQNEIKTLLQKLEKAKTEKANAEKAVVEAKAASVPPESRLPQPAKLAHPAHKIPSQAGQPVNEALQAAQLKIDLYTDFTGLIIRNVKIADDGHEYDCIQTGRNGTLHFKLAVDMEDFKVTPFEEIEFAYTPQLDQSRDKDLLALMPEYLADDITFARANAQKFYARVVEAVCTKRVQEDEE